MIVDLRSDTVTRPTAAMRRVMADADVGDDVFGEDPTVNRLEAVVAERLGKEAALYVPSGTQANQIAIRCLTEPGDEVILEQSAHPFLYEAGGPAVISGLRTPALALPVRPTVRAVALTATSAVFARRDLLKDFSAWGIRNMRVLSGGSGRPCGSVMPSIRRGERWVRTEQAKTRS